ncbi:MAG: hypothetical protein OXF00_01160 [bacterium]|nr:hypothetical protein [bacterium]
MKNKKRRGLIGVLLALAMIAAACGGNDDDGNGGNPAPASATEAPAEAEPGPGSPAPETESEEAAPAEPAPGIGDAPETEEPVFEPAPTEEPAPEIPLTATWRGVTADTITIGVTYLDIDQLVELGFSPATWGDQELMIQALADDVNERGGINGRQLEVVMDKYSPIGATEAG